jgi:hypothetical protein
LGHYKFLDSRFINCLLAGQLRFGRLLYYRMLETVTKDCWIGDALEGVAHTKIDGLHISPETPNPLARKRLREARIVEMSELSTMSITNSTFTQEIDCFVFCFASGDLQQLTKTMCPSDRPEYAYDGCVSIADPALLAYAILDSGKIDGQPVRDSFSLQLGTVDYEPAEDDFLSKGVAPADPFKKNHRYAAQQEARIVLIPRLPIDSDFITVTVQRPEIVVREEFRDLDIGMAAITRRPNDDRSPRELFDVIADGLRVWDAFASLSTSRMMAGKSFDERVEQVRREGEDQANAFDKGREEIIQAYWTLRKTLPDKQIDLDVARSAKAFVFCNHLRNYLRRISSTIATETCFDVDW